jgi:hypothetical protein
MFKSKSTVFGILVVLIVIAIFGYRYYLNNTPKEDLSVVTKSSDEVKTTPESAKNNLKAEDKFLRAKLENVKSDYKFNKDANPIPDVLNVRKYRKDQVYLCQPDEFDPKTVKYEKVVNQSLSPSEFYEITNPKDPDKTSFQIDGWNKEGEDKLSLPDNFDSTQYKFGCASQFDSVLVFRKGGQVFRTFTNIITNVSQKTISEDKRFLVLENYELDGANYIFKTRIYDIINDKLIDIPQIDCILSLNVFWSGNLLISTEEISQAKKICIWDQQGQLKTQLDYPLATSSASKVVVDANLSVIGDYVSIYNHYTPLYKPYDSCILSVFNLKTSESKETTIIKSNDMGKCPNINVKSIMGDELVFAFENNNE